MIVNIIIFNRFIWSKFIVYSYTIPFQHTLVFFNTIFRFPFPKIQTISTNIESINSLLYFSIVFYSPLLTCFSACRNLRMSLQFIIVSFTGIPSAKYLITASGMILGLRPFPSKTSVINIPFS